MKKNFENYDLEITPNMATLGFTMQYFHFLTENFSHEGFAISHTIFFVLPTSNNLINYTTSVENDWQNYSNIFLVLSF